MNLFFNLLFTLSLIVAGGVAFYYAYVWALEPLLRRYNIPLKVFSRDEGYITIGDEEEAVGAVAREDRED